MCPASNLGEQWEQSPIKSLMLEAKYVGWKSEEKVERDPCPLSVFASMPSPSVLDLLAVQWSNTEGLQMWSTTLQKDTEKRTGHGFSMMSMLYGTCNQPALS